MLMGMAATSAGIGTASDLGRDNNTVGLSDWLSRTRRRSERQPALTWTVVREGSDVVVEPSRGAPLRLSLGGVRAVRIVPLSRGQQHMTQQTGGWQVTLRRDDGDLLVGEPFADWQPARALADLLMLRTELPLDELSARLFSRVGQYPPPEGG